MKQLDTSAFPLEKEKKGAALLFSRDRRRESVSFIQKRRTSRLTSAQRKRKIREKVMGWSFGGKPPGERTLSNLFPSNPFFRLFSLSSFFPSLYRELLSHKTIKKGKKRGERGAWKTASAPKVVKGFLEEKGVAEWWIARGGRIISPGRGFQGKRNGHWNAREKKKISHPEQSKIRNKVVPQRVRLFI